MPHRIHLIHTALGYIVEGALLTIGLLIKIHSYAPIQTPRHSPS